MEQYELNTDPAKKEAYKHTMSAMNFLEISLKNDIKARSEKEAFGNVYNILGPLRKLDKDLKKIIDDMAGYLKDSKTTIEHMDKIRKTSEQIMTVAMEMSVTAALSIKRLTYQDLEEEGEEE